MRERLDCALLALGQDEWLRTVAGSKLGGRLILHALSSGYDSIAAMLADPAMARGRYDAAVMYVNEATLGAWRMALAAHSGGLPAALIVYADGLRPQAVQDLLALGASDFMSPPFCPEELRTRIENLLMRQTLAQVSESGPDYGRGAGVPPGTRAADAGEAEGNAFEAALCGNILERSGAELEAYAVALATQRASSRASFRAAKGEIVARFERAYIRAALGRHGGNITLAARMAQKHRRAFWALMRKHDIDPAPYRVDGCDVGVRLSQSG